MSHIQIFLMFAIWVPVVITGIILGANADRYSPSDNERKVTCQIGILWAIQLILAIIGSAMHVLLLPMAIACVVVLGAAIMLSVSKKPVKLKEFFSKDGRSIGETGIKAKTKAKKFFKKPIWKILGVLLLVGALGWGAFALFKASAVLVNQGERAVKF